MTVPEYSETAGTGWPLQVGSWTVEADGDIKYSGTVPGPGYFGPRSTDGRIHEITRPSSTLVYAGMPIRTKADLSAARQWDRMGERSRRVPWTSYSAQRTWLWARIFGVVPNTPASLGGWIADFGLASSDRPENMQRWLERIRGLQKCLEAALPAPAGPYPSSVLLEYRLGLRFARSGLIEALGCSLPASPVSSHPGDYAGPYPPPITGVRPENTEPADPGREPGVIFDPEHPEETETSTPLEELPPPPEEEGGTVDPTGPPPPDPGTGDPASAGEVPRWIWWAAAGAAVLLLGRRS